MVVGVLRNGHVLVQNNSKGYRDPTQKYLFFDWALAPDQKLWQWKFSKLN